MKDIVLNTIKSNIAKFSDKDSLSLTDIETLCKNITSDLNRNDEISNTVIIDASPHKCIEDGEYTMTAIDADGWDDAEELTLFMSIERPRPRKDKKLHEEIVEESISILKELIPMQYFEDFSDDDVWQETREDGYETMTIISYYLPSFYSNHESFHNR